MEELAKIEIIVITRVKVSYTFLYESDMVQRIVATLIARYTVKLIPDEAVSVANMIHFYEIEHMFSSSQ